MVVVTSFKELNDTFNYFPRLTYSSANFGDDLELIT